MITHLVVHQMVVLLVIEMVNMVVVVVIMLVYVDVADSSVVGMYMMLLDGTRFQ